MKYISESNDFKQILLERFLKYVKIWSKMYYFYAGISYLLFIATFLFGRKINGAKNWIRLGSNFAFQPSELIKIAFVFLIAAFYKNRDKFEKDFFKKYSLHFFFYTFLGFLFLQKDWVQYLCFQEFLSLHNICTNLIENIF